MWKDVVYLINRGKVVSEYSGEAEVFSQQQDILIYFGCKYRFEAYKLIKEMVNEGVAL